MCGRFTQQRPTAELAALFDAEPLVDDPGGHFNLAPTQEAAVVVERDERRAVTAYRWGLIPSWAKDPKIASRLFNARAETVATSGAFRDSFRKRRCIVPADGFYEWRRDATSRQPFLIHRVDGAPLALAGLWSAWRDPVTEQIRRTFTILTTTPNELISTLHDRMPVILDARDWALWLDPTLTDVGELHGLLRPASSEPLELYPVRPLVNSVRNDGPELILPAPD
jgi:putative SOS response-associated peptidase YedK